jgi:hypothetical protein
MPTSLSKLKEAASRKKSAAKVEAKPAPKTEEKQKPAPKQEEKALKIEAKPTPEPTPKPDIKKIPARPEPPLRATKTSTKSDTSEADAFFQDEPEEPPKYTATKPAKTPAKADSGPPVILAAPPAPPPDYAKNPMAYAPKVKPPYQHKMNFGKKSKK